MVYARNNRVMGTGGMILTGTDEVLEKHPPHSHYVHHKSHTDNPRTESKPLQSETDN